MSGFNQYFPADIWCDDHTMHRLVKRVVQVLGAWGAMHRTTIIFSDRLWRAIQKERGDTTASDYVREAVLARIFFERGLSDDADIKDALKRAKEALDED